MLPPAARELPFRSRVQDLRWLVVVRSDQGLVRKRLEDAWAVHPNARLGGEPVSAFAVFDGLGGEPNGQEAAWTAAEEFPRALERASTAAMVLPLLNEYVKATGGFTTAAVALLDARGSGQLLNLGDSAAYALDAAGSVVLLSTKDREAPNRVTRFLGADLAETAPVGFHLPVGRALLLCTDGVDDVAGTEEIQRVLTSVDLDAALDALFLRVREGGAPDNATVVAVRRLS